MTHYWHLALRGLARDRSLSILVILVMSLGIGASTTMMTVLHTLGADPLPQASDRVFHPQLEPSVAGRPRSPGALPKALTWTDATNLLHATEGLRKAIVIDGEVRVASGVSGTHARDIRAVYSQAALFGMFRIPFARGGGWSAEDDRNGGRVTVVSRRLARQLFGTSAVVGRLLRIGDHDFRITGVADDWDPRPRFHDLAAGAFAPPEDVFLPLRTARALDLPTLTSPTCWGRGMPDLQHPDAAPCTWVEFWVELHSAAARGRYLAFLARYASAQKAAGRFYGPPNVRLPDVTEWLATNGVVPRDARLQSFIAGSFLVLCVFNAGALLLIMFLRRRRELGLRRALGATRRQLVADLVSETSGLAAASAVGGCLLAWAGLALVRSRPEAWYAHIHADRWMLASGVATAAVCVTLAALLPAWQVARAHPMSMIRS